MKESFCPKCGVRLELNSNFCTKCGAKINSDSTLNNTNNIQTSKKSNNIFRNFAIISVIIGIIFFGFIFLGTPSEMQQFCTWLGETKAGSTYEGCMAGDYSNNDYEMWIGFTG